MIDVAVEYVSHIETGYPTKIAKDAKVCIGWYEASLEDLFTQCIGKRMRHLAIVFH